jgi:hypothetical protein
MSGVTRAANAATSSSDDQNLRGAPAGARGLRTPKSLRRAAAMAANLEEDEEDGRRDSNAASSSVGGDILRLGTPPSTGVGRYWDDDVQSVKSSSSSVIKGMPSPSVYEAKNSRRLNMLKAVEHELSSGGGTDLRAIQSYLDSRESK